MPELIPLKDPFPCPRSLDSGVAGGKWRADLPHTKGQLSHWEDLIGSMRSYKNSIATYQDVIANI